MVELLDLSHGALKWSSKHQWDHLYTFNITLLIYFKGKVWNKEKFLFFLSCNLQSSSTWLAFLCFYKNALSRYFNISSRCCTLQWLTPIFAICNSIEVAIISCSYSWTIFIGKKKQGFHYKNCIGNNTNPCNISPPCSSGRISTIIASGQQLQPICISFSCVETFMEPR